MRPAAALVVLLLAAVLAGCGSSGAKDNGEAAKAPKQVLVDMKQAAAGASAVHIAGSIVTNGTPITLDVTIVRGTGGKGSLSENGLRFELIKAGDKVYIQGSQAFYEKFAGKAAAQLLKGKWLQGSATTGQLASVGDLVDIDKLLGQISAGKDKLVNEGDTTYQGQKVVAIRDASKGGTLYVAATGQPYPVALVGSKQDTGTLTFDGWNEKVAIAAPKGAIDLSQLGG